MRVGVPYKRNNNQEVKIRDDDFSEQAILKLQTKDKDNPSYISQQNIIDDDFSEQELLKL